jgi:hypothetical protein
MQIHTVLDNAEVGLAEIGGEGLADSGFENEDPDTNFAADAVAPITANQRED